MRLILLGPPGAGKSTLGRWLALQLDVPCVSTSTLLRDTGAGSLARPGELVSDSIVNRVVLQHLGSEHLARGWVMDGYPRTLAQVQALAGSVVAFGHRSDRVLLIDVDEAELSTRIAGRRVCSGCGASYHEAVTRPNIPDQCDLCARPLTIRSDDRAEVVGYRVAQYRRRTEPVVDHYAKLGLLRRVVGTNSTPESLRATAWSLLEP
jgi:adenylate kinase